ncbi:MAG: PIN domain-containing protein [bacterium]
MIRVFLDANILFSAAYKSESRLLVLWQMGNVQLVTSQYAVEEAARNLSTFQQQETLTQLLKSIEIASVVLQNSQQAAVSLPTKDLPILQAALHAKVTFIITGDIQHFGTYFGQNIAGTIILPPAEFIKQYPTLIKQP